MSVYGLVPSGLHRPPALASELGAGCLLVVVWVLVYSVYQVHASSAGTWPLCKEYMLVVRTSGH